MTVTPVFRTRENSVATYSFAELASGQGYITMYGGQTLNTTQHLSSFTYYSENTTVVSSTGSVSTTDFDFDIPVLKPIILKGKAIISATMMFYVGAAARTATANLVATLYHYDGATETSIGTGTSTATTADNAYGTGATANKAISFTVTNKAFKIGDTIRLTIRINISASNSAGNFVYLCCDPKNTTVTIGSATSVNSQLLFNMPVRIDL